MADALADHDSKLLTRPVAALYGQLMCRSGRKWAAYLWDEGISRKTLSWKEFNTLGLSTLDFTQFDQFDCSSSN